MIKDYSKISFKKTDGGFVHNFGSDFACFALWKSAQPFRQQIRQLLQEQFEVLLETEIVWSDQHFHHNANRLYEAPIFEGQAKSSLHAEKIGGNTFVLFVVKDSDPRYTFAMSVSKKIELSNLNVVNAKYTIRDWIKKDSGIKYGVHSTNSIYEFFVQAPLLLGIDLFDRLLNGEKLMIDRLEKDLEGAEGWKDYREVFQILNLSSNYLVQRSFETLPEKNEEKDLDLLADNYQRLASALGITQDKKRPYKGTVTIGGEEISIDIRFVGDKYYDVSWQKDMLRYKVFRNGLYIPREDDYFFSLLFHSKVQKPEVKKKYYGILSVLAQQLHFDWFDHSLLSDDKTIGEILNGYFKSNGYFYEAPVDKGVYRNTSVTKHIQKNNLISAREIRMQNLKTRLKKILPKPVVEGLKKVLKK